MKKVCTILLLFLLPVFLFANGGQEEAKAASNEPITLKFWTHEDAARTKLETELIAEFQKTHPNVTVERTVQGTTKIIELVQTAFAANEGPDLFNLPIANEYAYMVNGRVAPIDYQAAGYKSKDDFVSKYMNGSLDAVTMDGKIYGLPLELTNWCLYVNKRVFKSAGLDAEKDYPKTWEDMMDVASKLCLRDGQILTRRAFDFNYDLCMVQFEPLVLQLGGKILSDDGKEAIVGKDAWIKFFSYMQEWGPNGKNYGSPTYTISRKLFNKDNNDIGMALAGLYQEPRIKSDNAEFYNSGDWMVVPFPVFKDSQNKLEGSCLAHYYMVNAQSSPAKQKAAWELAGLMLGHPVDYLDRVQIIQPIKSLIESDTFKNKPYSSVFRQGLERGKVTYYGKGSVEIQTQLSNIIKRVMLEGLSPEDAYNQLKKASQQIIDNY